MFKSTALAVLALMMTGTVLAQTEATPNYSVVARIAGPDGGWDLLGVDPVAGRLYVARGSGVMAVNLASGKVTPSLVPGTGAHAAMPIPDTTRVVSTNGAANTATIFEGATGEVIATLPVGTKPDAVAWDAATRTAWAMTPGSGDISVVDPMTAKVVATVAVGGSLELGAADGEGLLYVNVEDKNEVAVLDTRARKVLTRFPLKGCDRPTGIAYARDVKLIVSACANGVAVISAPDGTLYVIHLSPKPEVVQRLETARGARTIALDSATGRLYLPSARYEPSVGATRPTPIPGTFEVLVVAPPAALATGS